MTVALEDLSSLLWYRLDAVTVEDLEKQVQTYLEDISIHDSEYVFRMTMDLIVMSIVNSNMLLAATILNQIKGTKTEELVVDWYLVVRGERLRDNLILISLLKSYAEHVVFSNMTNFEKFSWVKRNLYY